MRKKKESVKATEKKSAKKGKGTRSSSKNLVESPVPIRQFGNHRKWEIPRNHGSKFKGRMRAYFG